MNSEVKQFFKKEGSKVIFIGETLKVYIAKRFKNFACLKISDKISTLAIFELEVIDKGKTYKSGFFLPRIIVMESTEIEEINKDEEKYILLTLKKGNAFIETTELIQMAGIGWVVFYEYINSTKTPSFITYDDKAFMFDKVSRHTGINFNVDHSIFEILIAHLSRKQGSPTIQYRHTAMEGRELQIPLSDVSHASVSTSSRLIGTYFANGINASLVQDNKNLAEIENLLRM